MSKKGVGELTAFISLFIIVIIFAVGVSHMTTTIGHQAALLVPDDPLWAFFADNLSLVFWVFMIISGFSLTAYVVTR